MNNIKWLYENLSKKDKILSIIMLIIFIISIIIIVFISIKRGFKKEYIAFLLLEFLIMMFILSIRIQKTIEENY